MDNYLKSYMTFLMTSLALALPQKAQGMDLPPTESRVKRSAPHEELNERPTKKPRNEENALQGDATPSPQAPLVYPYDLTEEEAKKANTHNNKIESHVIKSIGAIHAYLENCPIESTLVVLDWDDTVTNQFGENYGNFREKMTKDVIETIKSKGFDLLYLTARLQGESIEKAFPDFKRKNSIRSLNNFVDRMNKDGILDGYKTLKSVPTKGYDKVLMDLPIFRKEADKGHMILTNNIVFSGPKKGPALSMLLDLNRFGKQPSDEYEPFFSSNRVHEKVIFVDDSSFHIRSMEEAFQGRPEDLVTLYYPVEN